MKFKILPIVLSAIIATSSGFFTSLNKVFALENANTLSNDSSESSLEEGTFDGGAKYHYNTETRAFLIDGNGTLTEDEFNIVTDSFEVLPLFYIIGKDVQFSENDSDFANRILNLAMVTKQDADRSYPESDVKPLRLYKNSSFYEALMNYAEKGHAESLAASMKEHINSNVEMLDDSSDATLSLYDQAYFDIAEEEGKYGKGGIINDKVRWSYVLYERTLKAYAPLKADGTEEEFTSDMVKAVKEDKNSFNTRNIKSIVLINLKVNAEEIFKTYPEIVTITADKTYTNPVNPPATTPTTTTTTNISTTVTTAKPVTSKTTAETKPVTSSLGDINGDGKITSEDATAILIYYANWLLDKNIPPIDKFDFKNNT